MATRQMEILPSPSWLWPAVVRQQSAHPLSCVIKAMPSPSSECRRMLVQSPNRCTHGFPGGKIIARAGAAYVFFSDPSPRAARSALEAPFWGQIISGRVFGMVRWASSACILPQARPVPAGLGAGAGTRFEAAHARISRSFRRIKSFLHLRQVFFWSLAPSPAPARPPAVRCTAIIPPFLLT